LDLLLDTQVLVCIGTGDRRLSPAASAAITNPDNKLLVSAATAFEFADLRARGRYGDVLKLDDILDRLHATVVELPSAAWQIAATLPPVHSKPVDRMLIAHAIHADLTLVTADAAMQLYPVQVLAA
jgi:PIN domain nuclease of toxin-antitoxin system